MAIRGNKVFDRSAVWCDWGRCYSVDGGDDGRCSRSSIVVAVAVIVVVGGE